MKIIVSRKSNAAVPTGEVNIANLLSSGLGNSYKFVSDEEAEGYINLQVLRGFVCFSFDFSGTFHAHTTVVKAA